MSNMRIEVDLLGEREVSNDVYWGIHTLRAVENFNISKIPFLMYLSLCVVW
ncbi:L-aspartate AnsB [Glaesserella parasuis]|uniref:L-aspartate AnsB n=1 Tax=Glaesserella parasuis TaxID=738 RepID=UPI003B51CB79